MLVEKDKEHKFVLSPGGKALDLEHAVPLVARVLLRDLVEGYSLLELVIEEPIGPCVLQEF